MHLFIFIFAPPKKKSSNIPGQQVLPSVRVPGPRPPPVRAPHHRQHPARPHVHQGRPLPPQKAPLLNPAQHSPLLRVHAHRPHHQPLQQGRGVPGNLHSRLLQNRHLLPLQHPQHTHHCVLLDALRAHLPRAHLPDVHVHSAVCNKTVDQTELLLK